MPSPPSPTVLERIGGAFFGRAATLLAGIRAGGDYLCRLPKHLFKALSGMCDRSGAVKLVRLTVAGAAQVRCCRAGRRNPPASR
jgi:hypothetical protein